MCHIYDINSKKGDKLTLSSPIFPCFLTVYRKSLLALFRLSGTVLDGKVDLEVNFTQPLDTQLRDGHWVSAP